MERVLIVNAVPVNTGDAALMLSLYHALKNRGVKVSVATHFCSQVKCLYPNVTFVKDILDYSVIRRIRKYRFFQFLFIPILLLFLKPYREASIIIASPGGYINSFYGIFDRIYVLWICKLLGKKVVIYSQSIGPLNRKDTRRFANFAKCLDLIYARDTISYETAVTILGESNRIQKTEDAAFLLYPEFEDKGIKKKVAVSVRDWKFEGRDREGYYLLVARLVKLAVDRGYTVDFLSTCQGADNYIDDSVVADKIVSKHLYGIGNITVNRDLHGLDELRKILCNYDFVIGTRLHMCILSMLSGVPAFNISYEVKGRECYSYMGIPGLSIDYNAGCDAAADLFVSFMKDIDKWRSCIRNRVVESHRKANGFFDKFCEVLGI